jgi:nicotinamidase-related amidase
MEAIAAAAGRAAIAPASGDSRNVHLLIVDMQVDFCHEDGALFVPGAREDIERLARFIFRYGDAITNITCTLDSHLPFQVFHPAWWVDSDGEHPSPLTTITAADVEAGRWRPVVMPAFSREYVRILEEQSKKKLTVWPYHVLIGGLGNALDPMLWSVVMWHSLARKSQPAWLVKGRVPQSEHYSAIQPEVPVPSHPQGTKHEPFLRDLDEADILIIAGEAQSHCVLETLEDIVAHYRNQPEQLEKIYVLEDCMSPVAHPTIDFEAISREFFAKWAGLGVNFVRSTDELPIAQERSATAEAAATVDYPVVGLERMANWRVEQASETNNT